MTIITGAVESQGSIRDPEDRSEDSNLAVDISNRKCEQGPK